MESLYGLTYYSVEPSPPVGPVEFSDIQNKVGRSDALVSEGVTITSQFGRYCPLVYFPLLAIA